MNSADYITKPSPWPVSDTVQRFEVVIAEKGMTRFATIDQRAAAEGAGLSLRDTVLILFGSPAAGTPVMDAVPLAALDLPLKLLVWDQDGQTQVSYLSPPALAARYGLTDSLARPLGGIEPLADAVLAAS